MNTANFNFIELFFKVFLDQNFYLYFSDKMPRGTKLTEREIGRIEAYKEEGKGLRAMARALGRSAGLIKNYLDNPEGYGKKKRKGRKRKLSKRVERQIGRAASNSTKSVNQIKSELDLDVSKVTIWRALKRNPHIERQKLNKAPRLLERHKVERRNFGQANMSRDWKKVGLLGFGVARPG